METKVYEADGFLESRVWGQFGFWVSRALGYVLWRFWAQRFAGFLVSMGLALRGLGVLSVEGLLVQGFLRVEGLRFRMGLPFGGLGRLRAHCRGSGT